MNLEKCVSTHFEAKHIEDMRRIGKLLPLNREIMIHDFWRKEERRGEMMVNRGKKESIRTLFDRNLAMKVGME
jgi:hypothetical protein